MNIKNLSITNRDTIFQIKVTPEVAEELLKFNYEEQRPIQKHVVKGYVSDMLAGRWNCNVKQDLVCIVFDDDGNIVRLTNGQHRLTAIIESGVTEYIWIVRDTIENFTFMDGGTKRQISDFLSLPNAKRVVSLVRKIIYTIDGRWSIENIVKRGTTDQGNIYTARYILDFINSRKESDNQIWQNALDDSRRILVSIGGKGHGEAAAYFCWLVSYLENDSALEDFISDLEIGVSTKPINILFKQYYLTEISRDVEIKSESLLLHLLWLYNNQDSQLKKYPKFQKVEQISEKYNLLVKIKANKNKTEVNK